MRGFGGLIGDDQAAPHDPSSTVEMVGLLASRVAFGQPLITNTFRGLIAEAIVSLALGEDWVWCSADYAAWDFENDRGARLEVKQSAAKQTWRRSPGKRSTCRFDIKPRLGRYENFEWVAHVGRQAHVYVFAHHFVDDEGADHRDPSQWCFYVVPAQDLPAGNASIGLASISRLATPCSHAQLSNAVSSVLRSGTHF